MSSVTFTGLACVLLSCLMLHRPVAGQDLQREQLSPRVTCPKGSMAYGSHCYALFFSPKSWPEAHLACQKRSSGHLASVLTASEGYFLASMIRNTGSREEYIWIGLHDPTEGRQPNGGGWEWSSGDVPNYKAWEKLTSPYPDPGYCGSLSETSKYEEWRARDCRKALPYVCKFKP